MEMQFNLMVQFIKYLWDNSEILATCWDQNFYANKAGPPGQGRRGFDQYNTSVEQLQAILDIQDSPWVSLFRCLGIPINVPLRPGTYCKIHAHRGMGQDSSSHHSESCMLLQANKP